MPRTAVAGVCRTIGYAVPALAALALCAPGPAAAQTGGTSPAGATPVPPAAKAPASVPVSANLYGRPAPRITRVLCRTSCADAATARPGSLVRVYGTNLRRLDEIIFLGAAGEADDASVPPITVGRKSLVARVPRTARSGPLALARTDGTRSRASRTTLAVQAEPVALPAGTIDAEVQGHTVFYGAQRPAELSYVVGGDAPARVKVELIRGGDGTAVTRWEPGEVPPGVPQTIRWDGTVGGRLARSGVYQFRVTATDATGVQATSSQAAPAPADPHAPGSFRFLRYRFPIVGAHDYGQFVARFGGGRGHQGQDVFAACGTPLVAARGGVVKFKQYHARAGYYLVIDGDRTSVDFAYMHMREAALVDRGERVKTGQLIGYVGDTGDADGCHLHFEEWSGPGWYSGGRAFDPLPDLQAWDAQS